MIFCDYAGIKMMHAGFIIIYSRLVHSLLSSNLKRHENESIFVGPHSVLPIPDRVAALMLFPQSSGIKSHLQGSAFLSELLYSLS